MTTKNYFKIPVILIIISFLTSCSNNNDWNTYGLNGKVKTYSEREYFAKKKFDEWEKRFSWHRSYERVTFDSEGNCQWIEDFDSDNELSAKLIIKRENGDVIERQLYDEDGKLIVKGKIIHNSKDEIEEFIDYNKDGEKTRQGKKYFANNRVIKEQWQTFEDNKVKEEYTIVFEYDKNNRVIKKQGQVFKDNNKVGEYTCVFEYDKDGNLLSEKSTDKQGVIYFEKYEYLAFDENKNWTKRLYSFSYDKEATEHEYIQIREYEYY